MRITLYLLRQSADFGKSVLSSPKDYRARQLRNFSDQSLELILFVRNSFEHATEWFKYLRPLLDEDRDPITVRSAGAVLLRRLTAASLR